jgi:hypothetical protein
MNLIKGSLQLFRPRNENKVNLHEVAKHVLSPSAKLRTPREILAKPNHYRSISQVDFYSGARRILGDGPLIPKADPTLRMLEHLRALRHCLPDRNKRCLRGPSRAGQGVL